MLLVQHRGEHADWWFCACRVPFFAAVWQRLRSQQKLLRWWAVYVAAQLL
jgi:hypothetical protein